MKYLIIITFFFAALFLSSATAQSQSIDLKHYSTRDGLSQSVVWEIERDSLGYLWLGTEEGVNRYDAYRLETISGPDGVLNARYIGLLHNDREGMLWLSAAPNFNYRYDPETTVIIVLSYLLERQKITNKTN